MLQDLDDIMNYYSRNIASSIANINYFNIDDVASIVKAQLFLAIKDCQESELEKEQKARAKMVEEYSAPSTPNWRKMQLNTEISKANVKIKAMNKSTHLMKDKNDYDALKKYIRSIYGDSVIQDFIKIKESNG